MSELAITEVRLLKKNDEQIIVGILQSNYRLHLKIDAPIATETGKRVEGRILATTYKIDNTGRGGAYIEPVFGRPRRIQGRLIAVDTDQRILSVSIQGCPIHCQVPDRIELEDYTPNQLIAIELERGARFEPATVTA